jgi:DnaJ-class molecular chaperone
MDPYEILGLTYPASKEEIKNRYYELAKKHHPDKLSHLAEEEKKEHEEMLKKINVAYELLSKSDFEYSSQSDWKGIWSSVESFMTQNYSLGDLFANVINIAKEYKKQKSSEHYITVDVTLEEVHQRKDKKLRLFLKNISDPIFITVDCGCHPSYLYTHLLPDQKTIFIYITFNLLDHPLYITDTIFNSYNLYMNIEINLYEYFHGVVKKVKYLDHNTLEINILPCSEKSIIIPNKGLFGKDALTVYLSIQLPAYDQFNKLSDVKKSKLLKYLKETHHSGVKTI